MYVYLKDAILNTHLEENIIYKPKDLKNTQDIHVKTYKGNKLTNVQ